MTPTIPTPQMPEPIRPVTEPKGKKPGRRSQQPTFLSEAALTQSPTAGKTLMGQ